MQPQSKLRSDSRLLVRTRRRRLYFLPRSLWIEAVAF